MTRYWLLTTLALLACGETRQATSPAKGGQPAVAGEATVTAGGGNGGSSGGHVPSSGGSSVTEAGQPAEGGSAGAPASCDWTALEDLSVFSPSWDPLGYPPYAVDGCSLVYVAGQDDAGALYRVDLSSGERELLDDAVNHPRRPTIAAGVIAWERDGDGGSSVRVLSDARDRTIDAAGEPRATADAVVYTAFLGAKTSDDTDVYLYDLGTDELVPVATGAGQQRFADISAEHVAVTDFSEDPSGYFDGLSAIADVVVFDREHLEPTPRPMPGKQAFPLLGDDGALVYLEWGAVHPEPKFSQFFLKAGNLAEPSSADINVKGEGQVLTDVAYVRPSLHGTRIDFIDRTDAVKLYSVDVLALAAPEAVSGIDAAQLFGPASSARVTLVSAPGASSALRLVAIER